MRFVKTITELANLKNIFCGRGCCQLSALMMASAVLVGCSTGPKVRGDAVIPVNVAPKSGSELVAGSSIEFVWQEAANVTHYDFHVFDRTNGVIAQQRSKMLAKDICRDGLCSITETVSVPVHPGHWWRVRGTNYLGVSQYNRNYFDMVNAKRVATSSSRSTALPPVPVVVAPTNGGSLAYGSKAKFQWEPDTDATSYDFHMFNTVEGTYVKRHTDVPARSICYSGVCELPVNMDLPSSDRHFWKVRAGNARGKSNWVTTRVSVTTN